MFAAIVLACVAPAAPPGVASATGYTVTSNAELQMFGAGAAGRTTVELAVKYAWEKRGDVRILTFKSLETKAKEDGNTTAESFMSSDRFRFANSGGKKVDVTAADAPQKLRTLLDDIFGHPLCERTVDPFGAEVKRVFSTRPGAKAVEANGCYTAALLFHGPYNPAKDDWTAPAELTLGGGGTVAGPLRYTRSGKGDGAVTVSGKLVRDVYTNPETGGTHRAVVYTVSGEQSYDSKADEWAGGKLAIDVGYQFETPGLKSVVAGTMKLKLERNK